MRSVKKLKLTVNKPENYKPIKRWEEQRITKLLGAAVLNVANRFDGPSEIEITIQAKGNA